MSAALAMTGLRLLDDDVYFEKVCSSVVMEHTLPLPINVPHLTRIPCRRSRRHLTKTCVGERRRLQRSKTGPRRMEVGIQQKPLPFKMSYGNIYTKGENRTSVSHCPLSSKT